MGIGVGGVQVRGGTLCTGVRRAPARLHHSASCRLRRWVQLCEGEFRVWAEGLADATRGTLSTRLAGLWATRDSHLSMLCLCLDKAFSGSSGDPRGLVAAGQGQPW